MDPATIAASVIAILAPYAKDAGKELVKTVGEVTVNKAKDLMSWLKKQLERDPIASSDLSRFEADPDKFESGLKATIQEQAEKDPTFAAEVKRRIDDIGPVIVVLQQMKKGEDITGVEADVIKSGKFTATQVIDEGKGVKGVKVKIAG